MSTQKEDSDHPNPYIVRAGRRYLDVLAHYDSEHITVYQAYNESIAAAAVSEQRLDASPLYKSGRMTWIKPSWCWMMYRSGYSFKDENQSHVLALKMRHENFVSLLQEARLAKVGKGSEVVVQWDPERDVRLEKLDWRSIQIGISGSVREKWIREWIVSIEDVTHMARNLRSALDLASDRRELSEGRLCELGCMPVEKVYELPEDVEKRLGMR